MKSLFLGIALIIILGFGGLVYRNAVEHPNRPIACPMDALVCPDGTSVARTGLSCTFPACPPPNVSLIDIGISYAVPDGFIVTALPDEASVVAYEKAGPTPTEPSHIIIRRFSMLASSTPLDVIKETAIGGTSGMPVPVTFFSSVNINRRQYTMVSIDRFEAVIDTAYYLVRETDVLRFDAVDRGVVDWTIPNLDITKLPANAALRKLLATLEGV
ncbi:MAG: hypothetical protein Q7R59_03080 [bacterium]|nr:hypothetical protein [bacterium]